MKQRNKSSLPRESRPAQFCQYLRERGARQGRIVYRQMLRGASYSLGSCAVTVAVYWLQSRF